MSCGLLFLLSKYWDYNPSREELLGRMKAIVRENAWSEGLPESSTSTNVASVHYFSSFSRWAGVIGDALGCPAEIIQGPWLWAANNRQRHSKMPPIKSTICKEFQKSYKTD